MRLARIATSSGPRAAVGTPDGWCLVEDLFAPDLKRTDTVVSSGEARLLPPVTPRVVLGMAHNGFPGDRERPAQAFFKSPRTVAGPGDEIGIDPALGSVDAEGELAIVIGRPAVALTVEDALDAVLGYTIGNDVTAVEQNPVDDLLTQSKNGRNFTPIGPWIETELDPDDVEISVSVNGGPAKRASTAQLARRVAEQLAYVTRYVALGPGDVVLAGCPGTNAAIADGDRVEIVAAGIGTLTNVVGAARTP